MPDATRTALQHLEPLVGDWNLSASIGEPGGIARTSFEWALDGRFLVQRSVVERSDIPDALSIISVDVENDDAFTQHYFDSRGVVRLYAMTFADGVWTLLREKPDFSSFDFAQRFVGELSPDGNTIPGRWEQRALDASEWQEDFRLTYTRA